MEMILAIVSLAGALFSTVTTCYFWLVKANRERPNLKSTLVEREVFLGKGTAESREIGLKLSLIVANCSSLPDAVLSVRLWMKHQDGQWSEVRNIVFDPKTPRPFNLPALQTVLLCVSGFLSYSRDESLEQAGKALQGYADKHWTNPRQVKVALRGLSQKQHENVVFWEMLA